MRTNETKMSRVWRSIVASLKRNRVFAIHLAVCIVAAALLLMFFGPGSVAIRRDYSGIKPGEVADRDIVAGREVVYVDEEATALRRDAEERLVLPVFQFDSGITRRGLDYFKDFTENFRSLSTQDIAQETVLLMLQSKFPGKLPPQVLADLANPPSNPRSSSMPPMFWRRSWMAEFSRCPPKVSCATIRIISS
jgi:hypothetical protein